MFAKAEEGSIAFPKTPTPMYALAVEPKSRADIEKIGGVLSRFAEEDPCFAFSRDAETSEMVIRGLGDQHLVVIQSKMKRHFKTEMNTKPPKIPYRETISTAAKYVEYTHKKQTGGAGQFGRVMGVIEPLAEGTYEFINEVRGGRIPREFIPACDKGFRSVLKKGRLIGFPIVGVRVRLVDGQAHAVDSSDIAFQAAAQGAFRQAYEQARPQALEPVMRVSVEGPSEFAGAVFASVNQRRGIIVSSVEDGLFARVDAEVPLSEMFGYSTVLRSLTQGKAEFTMEFLRYSRAPAFLADKLVSEFREKKSGETEPRRKTDKER